MRTALFAVLAAASLAAVLTPVPARASDEPDYAGVRRVLESMRLLGRWSVDCNDEGGTSDWENIEVTDKGVVQSVEGGGGVISTYYIIEARRLDRTDVQMKFLYVPENGTDAEGDDLPSPDFATTVVYRVEADRQMTWSSAGPDGAPTITAGAFIDSDEHSKWYNRCPAEAQR